MNRNAVRPVLFSLALLVLLVALGIWGLFAYIQLEQRRDLADWQQRLGMLADDRVADIEAWVQAQFAPLDELANNASLQLYVSQLGLAGTPEAGAVEPAQLGYLRNLIVASAERAGYLAPAPQVPANLPPSTRTGLAVLDGRGNLRVATPGFPTLGAQEQALVERVLSGNRAALQALPVGADGSLRVAFAVPVPAVQGLGTPGRPVGVLLGIRRADTELLPRLQRSSRLAGETRSLLVTLEDNLVVLLGPLADGSRPGERRLALDTPGLAATELVRKPGGFGLYRDHQGREVLATSRPVPSLPWVLIQQADAAAALRESREHARFLLSVFGLALALVAIGLVAAWRHGSSIRAQAMNEELRRKSQALETQTHLLHAVTDNIQDFICLLDAQGRLLFANQALARALDVTPADLRGKDLASVLGPDTARRLEDWMQAPHEEGQVLELDIAGRSGRYQCVVQRLPDQPDLRSARLLVLHDVTELEEAQRKRARQLTQLVQALMRAVDKHDPYSADHSARTARVAVAIGKALELPPRDLQTLELAASLANVGKIFVPKEILTKTGPLTPEEQAILQQHVQYSLDILSTIEFDGPVLETIAQKQEHLDGSGYPKGLTGDRILLTAKILAVANAFVALVSPRAYRDAVDVETALSRLLEEAGSKYDRHVVAALFHIAENRRDELEVKREG